MSALALTLASVYPEVFLLFSLVLGISSAKEGSGRELNIDGWMDVYQVGKQNFKTMWVKMGKVIGNKIILFTDSESLSLSFTIKKI